MCDYNLVFLKAPSRIVLQTYTQKWSLSFMLINVLVFLLARLSLARLSLARLSLARLAFAKNRPNENEFYLSKCFSGIWN